MKNNLGVNIRPWMYILGLMLSFLFEILNYFYNHQPQGITAWAYYRGHDMVDAHNLAGICDIYKLSNIGKYGSYGSRNFHFESILLSIFWSFYENSPRKYKGKYMSFLNTFAEAGNKILQAEHPFISNVYCDLEFLQDLRFGALLLNLKSQEEVTYAYSQIDKYNTRLDERTTTYFPSLKLKEEVIDEALKDSVTYQKIACFAPMTSMFYNLTSIISMILRSNKYAESNVNKVLQLWISVDNLNYPKELLKRLAENLEETFNKKIVVNTELAKRYTQGLGYYLDKQMLFLYDFEQFVNRPEISMPFASEGKFTDHQIFARPQINPRFANLSKKELIDGVDKMRDQLGIYCDFEYCPSQIVIKKGGK